MKSGHIAILAVVIIIAVLIITLAPTEQLIDPSNTKIAEIPTADTPVEATPKITNAPIKKIVVDSKVTNNLVSPIPDFTSIKNVKLKKSTFFKFMNKNIEHANKKVLEERRHLLKLIKSYSINQSFSITERKRFKSLSKKYRVDKNMLSIKEKLVSLKQKINVVPTSLILAQSANESGWGTSRFARKGNNYFGQWCYSKGCGLVPASRDSDASHEVAKFSSVQKSVEEYVYNINVSRSYKQIRQLRTKMLNNDKPVDSLLLATGLERYSERGKEYVEEIQSMIRYNKLKKYDN